MFIPIADFVVRRPVAMLVIGQEMNRQERRKFLEGDARFKPKGAKQQLPGRRRTRYYKGGHNKDWKHR